MVRRGRELIIYASSGVSSGPRQILGEPVSRFSIQLPAPGGSKSEASDPLLLDLELGAVGSWSGPR